MKTRDVCWILNNARVRLGLARRFCSDKIEALSLRFPCQRIQSHLRLGRLLGFALHFAKRQPRFAELTTFPTTRILERVSPGTIRSRSAACQVGSASTARARACRSGPPSRHLTNSMRAANRRARLSGANTGPYSLSKQSAAANFHPIWRQRLVRRTLHCERRLRLRHGNRNARRCVADQYFGRAVAQPVWPSVGWSAAADGKW